MDFRNLSTTPNQMDTVMQRRPLYHHYRQPQAILLQLWWKSYTQSQQFQYQ